MSNDRALGGALDYTALLLIDGCVGRCGSRVQRMNSGWFGAVNFSNFFARRLYRKLPG